jgi:hypothetical protein
MTIVASPPSPRSVSKSGVPAAPTTKVRTLPGATATGVVTRPPAPPVPVSVELPPCAPYASTTIDETPDGTTKVYVPGV